MRKTAIRTHGPSAPDPIYGQGIHSGKEFAVSIAKRLELTGSGLRFICESNGDRNIGYATLDSVTSTDRRTSLRLFNKEGQPAGEIATGEHLLAVWATAGFPALDVTVTPFAKSHSVTDYELPFNDGSAKVWCDHSALSYPIHRPKFVWRVARHFEFRAEKGDSWIAFVPTTEISLRTNYFVSFGERKQETHSVTLPWTDPKRVSGIFRNELACARSFITEKDLEILQARGLVRGATLEAGILLKGENLIPHCELRYENELARHKILDFLGDASLLGAPLVGDVHVCRGGHGLHINSLKAALAAGAIVLDQVELHQPQNVSILDRYSILQSKHLDLNRPENMRIREHILFYARNPNRVSQFAQTAEQFGSLNDEAFLEQLTQLGYRAILFVKNEKIVASIFCQKYGSEIHNFGTFIDQDITDKPSPLRIIKDFILLCQKEPGIRTLHFSESTEKSVKVLRRALRRYATDWGCKNSVGSVVTFR